MKLFGVKIEVDASETKDRVAKRRERLQDAHILRQIEKEQKSLEREALRQIKRDNHAKAVAEVKARMLEDMAAANKRALLQFEAQRVAPMNSLHENGAG